MYIFWLWICTHQHIFWHLKSIFNVCGRFITNKTISWKPQEVFIMYIQLERGWEDIWRISTLSQQKSLLWGPFGKQNWCGIFKLKYGALWHTTVLKKSSPSQQRRCSKSKVRWARRVRPGGLGPRSLLTRALGLLSRSCSFIAFRPQMESLKTSQYNDVNKHSPIRYTEAQRVRPLNTWTVMSFKPI